MLSKIKYLIKLIKDIIRIYKLQQQVNKHGLKVKLRSKYLKHKKGYIMGLPSINKFVKRRR